MQREAEAHAEEDKKAKEEIEIKQQRRHARLPAREAAQGPRRQGSGRQEEASRRRDRQAVREALKGNDTDAIKTAYDDLQNKFQEVSAELYKQAAASAGASARSSRTGSATSRGSAPKPQTAQVARKDQRRRRRRGVRNGRRRQEEVTLTEQQFAGNRSLAAHASRLPATNPNQQEAKE